MNDNEIEEFIREISSIPEWVESGNDLLKYCRHIKYRLIQANKALEYFASHSKWTGEQSAEINQIMLSYDHAYNKDNSEFIDFANFINRKNTIGENGK